MILAGDNPPELGTLAELRFQLRCAERGIQCFAPIVGTNKGVDFVIDVDGVLSRIQVKKLRLKETPHGSAWLEAPTSKVKYDKYRADTGRELFEYYAFVCFEMNSIWLIPTAEVTTAVTWSKCLNKRHEIDPYLF